MIGTVPLTRKEANKRYRCKNHSHIKMKSDKLWRENKEQLKLKRRAQYGQLRDEILDHYGAFCDCCGEDHREFLTIDHINGGGNQHRKKFGWNQWQFYRWIKREEFPFSLRILCLNCNSSLGWRGMCPHDNADIKVGGTE